MTINKYRKKPVEIDACQWSETAAASTPIIDWILSNGGTARYHDRLDGLGAITAIVIDTLESTMTVSPDDWVIKGVIGEFYPCKPSIFDQTYEPVVQPQ